MLAMGRPGGTPMVATERLVTNLQPAAAAIARLACQAARHVGSAVHDLRSGASVVEPLRDTSISASIAPIRQVGLLFRQAGDVVGGVSRGDQLLAVGQRCRVLELALPALFGSPASFAFRLQLGSGPDCLRNLQERHCQ